MMYIILLIITFFLLIPLAIKWQLNLKIVIPWVVAMWVLECVTANVIYANFVGIGNLPVLVVCIVQMLFITAASTLFTFFRDPERFPPDDEKSIVSPADGTVV